MREYVTENGIRIWMQYRNGRVSSYECYRSGSGFTHFKSYREAYEDFAERFTLTTVECRTKYVSSFPRMIQSWIIRDLVAIGIEGDDLERAMNSRLCDLEDTLEIAGWR